MGFVVGVLLSFTTSSCSKDEMKIEGKWQSTSVNYEEYEAGQLVAAESETCVDWYIGFTFKSDGTGQFIGYEGGSSATYQTNWVIMGEKLMVTLYDEDESETLTFDIVEIKSNSMILSMTEEYTSNGIKCKDVATYNFKKI